MSVTKETLIAHFTARFLDQKEEVELKRLSDVLDLHVSNLRDISVKEISALRGYGVKTIRDLAKLKGKQVEALAQQTEMDPNRLHAFYVAAKMVARAWRKRASYRPGGDLKVAVVGLDNAGKTTVIDLIAGKSLQDAVNQDPTPMVNQVNVPSEKMNFVVWDFGGQIQHRQAYLDNPEDYFVGLDLAILVIDVQDPDRYDEALDYFTRLIEIVKYLGEKPYFLCMLHKADPELADDPELQIHLQYLRGRMEELLETTGCGWEIVKSSIYSAYRSQPQLVGFLKGLFGSEKKADVSEGYFHVLDAMAKLTNVVVEIGNALAQGQERLLQAMSELKASGVPTPPTTTQAPATQPTPPSTPPQGVPPPPSSTPPRPAKPDGGDRAKLMSELKELFKKRHLFEEAS
ncbi:MAG: hypothetical protein Kow0069_33720 [Promethearchaeota archaeon]